MGSHVALMDGCPRLHIRGNLTCTESAKENPVATGVRADRIYEVDVEWTTDAN